MPGGRAAEPLGSDECFDSMPGANGRVIEGGKGRSRGAEPTRRHNLFASWVRALVTTGWWHRVGIAAVLALSAFLNLYNLSGEGYSNTYYAAAVKNMLTSWHNFFFVSFDAGFVSVDKPPLGLWIQTASAYLFGLDGLSLLLPQALAGILSVALLYYLVRRAFGPVAGLIAALVLAVTPINVAVNRDNTGDSLLILALLVAVWALIKATEKGNLSWLLVGVVMVGLGFNIKMLEAYLVLPAFYLLYLLAAPVSWRRRLVHLGVATLVLLVVSLSWAVVVDLTPVDQRPYVGSSSDDSVMNLALAYNGLDRLRGVSYGAEGIMPAGTPGGPGSGDLEYGAPGPLRLLNHQLAGQIGWLLPLAAVGLLAASWQRRLRLPLERWQQALVLWGAWFLTAAGYFSIAGGGHRYYLVMLGPAIAALVGAGVVALWRDYRAPGRRGWLLPLTLVGMAGLQGYILSDYPDWRYWLTPLVLGLCFIAAAGVVFVRLSPFSKSDAYATSMVIVGVLALLIAPTTWAVYTTWQGSPGFLPVAGPQAARGPFGGGPPGGPPGGGPPPGGRPGAANPALVDYLLANQGNSKYLVAVTNAMSGAPIILATDEPVISLGGYNGVDPVFSADELSDLVASGSVRFFLMPDRQRMEEMMAERRPDDGSAQRLGQSGAPRGGPPGVGGLPQNGSASWVEDNCQQIPQELWQPSSSADQGRGGPPGMAQALYGCGAQGYS